MSNETQTQQTPAHTNDNDRAWAKKMAEEKERREEQRYEMLKQVNELTQRGVASVGVDVTDIKMKVDALYEDAMGKEPEYTFDRWVHKADKAIKRILPYLTVGATAAAIGYGGYRGAKAVRNGFKKKVDVDLDVHISPVGEPIKVEMQS